MTQAIIFDFDGLILDTEMPIFTAWQQIYSEHSCSLTLEEYASCVGGTHAHFNPYKDLEQKSGTPIAADELRPRVSEIYTELIARNDALPGIRDLLIAAEKSGIRTGLASNSDRQWVEGHLGRLGLLPHFEVIKTRDDVTRLKPEPDLYLAALKEMGVEAERAFALEDSPHGILAARRAGLFTVAVPNQITCTLPLNEPDICLSSLADTSLPALLEQIEERRRALT